MGFSTHPHRDMEILTWVLAGSLEHKDSLGSKGVIKPGLAQIMSAGTGILHSEFNGSPVEATHLLQIWILPEQKGIRPRYGQRDFSNEALLNRWCLMASRNGDKNSIQIFQDINILATRLSKGHQLEIPLPKERYGYLHVATGHLELSGIEIVGGDAFAIHDENNLVINAIESSEVFFFDMG